MTFFFIIFLFYTTVAEAYSGMMFLYSNEWLPPSIINKLETLSKDSFFYSDYEYVDMVSKIMDDVTLEQLEKMPDNSEYLHLNKTEGEQVRKIWKNVSISWKKRSEAVRKIVKKAENRILPYNIFHLQTYVSDDVYQNLSEIYNDTKLNEPEKFRKMDKVLASLNSSAFQNLPTPYFVSSFSDEKKVRAILYNFTENWETRDKKYNEYISKLPFWQKLTVKHFYSDDLITDSKLRDAHNWTSFYINWNRSLFQPPAPKSFRLALGNNAYKKLNNILSSPLGNQNCFKVMGDFFNNISVKAAEALPLSYQFALYPAEIQKNIKKIMMSETKDRWARIERYIEKVPVENRDGIFPPPPEYQSILTPSAWDHLTELHYNASLRHKKYARNTFLMSFPDEIRMQYPLPEFLQRLPEDKQIGLKKIYFNDSLTLHESYRSLRQYLQTFSKEELRQIFRPIGFSDIPKIFQDKIDAVIDKNGKYADISRLNSDFRVIVQNMTVRDFHNAIKKERIDLFSDYYPAYMGYPKHLVMGWIGPNSYS